VHDSPGWSRSSDAAHPVDCLGERRDHDGSRRSQVVVFNPTGLTVN
jgi:hypothetical protein